MAKKLPPEETRWKPGQSGNPGGKKKDLLTQSQVKGLISDFAKLDIEALAKIASDPKSTWTEMTLAKQMLNAPDDLATLNFVLDRSIGKVKDVKEVTVVPKPTIVQRSSGAQMILGAELKRIEAGDEE